MPSPSLLPHRWRTQEKEMKLSAEREKELEMFSDYYTDVAIHLELYSEHDNYLSQLVEAKLNYMQVSYRKNDSILIRYGVERTYKDEIPNFQYPLLKANISIQPSVFKAGEAEIQKFIMEERYFTKYTYIEQDARAKAGEVFVLEKIKPKLDLLFLNPLLAFSNSFKGSPRNMIFNQVNYLSVKLIRLALTKAFKDMFNAFANKRKNRKEYRNAKEDFMKGIEEWEGMLQGKDYHGGDAPDQADFVVCLLNNSSYLQF